MINDLGRRALAEAAANSCAKCLVSRSQVSLDQELLRPGCSKISLDKSLTYTNGWYYVRYKPSGSSVGRVKFFSIYCDLFPIKYFRVKDWNEFVERGNKDKRIKFVLEHTNVSEELFETAKESFGLPIPFVMDMVKYNKELKKKMEEQTGVYPDYSMLVDPLLILAEKERIRAVFASKNKEINI